MRVCTFSTVSPMTAKCQWRGRSGGRSGRPTPVDEAFRGCSSGDVRVGSRPDERCGQPPAERHPHQRRTKSTHAEPTRRAATRAREQVRMRMHGGGSQAHASRAGRVLRRGDAALAGGVEPSDSTFADRTHALPARQRARVYATPRMNAMRSHAKSRQRVPRIAHVHAGMHRGPSGMVRQSRVSRLPSCSPRIARALPCTVAYHSRSLMSITDVLMYPLHRSPRRTRRRYRW
jgi:hypothetical protein